MRLLHGRPVAGGGGTVYLLSSTNAVQTSAAGSAPYSFVVTMANDIFPGYYLDIERSPDGATSGGNYTTLSLSVSHQLTEQERADDFITQAALIADGYVAASGLFYERYRWRREDGAIGPWTQLSDTVSASVAVLVNANGVNKNQYVTITGSPTLTFTGNGSVGAYQAVRATIEAQSNKVQFEVTIGTVVAASWMLIGICDDTDNFNGGGNPGPGYTTNNGIAVRMHPDEVKVFWNTAVNSFQFAQVNGMVATGDVYAFEYDKVNHTLDVYRTRSGVTTKIGGQATGLPALAKHSAFAAPLLQQSGTFNFGASAFSHALNAGVNIYG